MDKGITMASPFVISVVLNFNHCADTLECIDSLKKNTYSNHHVILLDAGSSDGSVDAVREKFPAVQIICLTENLGYAGNNNVGIDAALKQGADWVFVLNEDTHLAEECISNLVKVGESSPKIGVVGPLVYHYDEPGIIQTAGGKMDRYYRGWHLGQNEPDQGQFQKPLAVDWISGCGIMVRAPAIEKAGKIDPRFYYYVEEFEWCVRIKEAGFELIDVPEAKMWHKGVQRDYQPKPSVLYYATRNQLLLLSKHHASLMAWIVTLFQFFRTMISWTVKPKWRSKRPYRDAMWQGLWDFFHQRWGRMPS